MNVRYRARALDDIDGIYEWVARRSVRIAADVEAAILTAAEWLGEHAEMGAITDEPNVRRWPMPEFRYTIFYLLEREQDRVDILRVLDGRRVRNVGRVPK
jgi:plasmid stabilization system protein ParE